ncbi:MAG: TonB-dependent receptor [Pseudomonadota bacterium]
MSLAAFRCPPAATFVLASLLILPARVAAQGEPVMEEVVVTGSRIARNPETYLGAMAVADSSEIERNVNNSVLDALLRIPSITNANGTGRNNSNNSSRGANFVEIHNLAPERTLVLMNGRRVVNSIRDSLGLAVDLQSFPPNMIDRVEVLADGASAVYGSDAVAGVVNIITKDNFEGLEFTAGAGTPEDDGGESFNFGALWGVQGNRGGFVAAMDVTDTEYIDLQDRSWSRDPILGRASDGAGGKLILFGSGNPPEGRVTAGDVDIIFKEDAETGASFQTYDTFGLSGLNGSAGDGSLQSIKDTGHRYNYNDPGGRGSALVSPLTSVNLGLSGSFVLGPNWSAYTNILANHREGTLNFTPLPISGAAGRFTDLVQVPYSNPNLPADARDFLQSALGGDSFQLAWRGADLGNRQFEYDVDTVQTTFGLEGDFSFAERDWVLDSWLTWGQSRLKEETTGQTNVANLQIASDPAQCATVASCPKRANGDPLFDPFGRSPKTQAEIDFLTFTDVERTEYEMWHLAATLSTADLFSLPAGNVGFASGLEYRDESGSVSPSPTVVAGDSGGNFAQPTDGGYDLWEIFAELDIPILIDAPAARELSMEAALRYSDYSDYDETTWKLGLRWLPLDWMQLRAQASTGFRAPNVLELFGGNADSFIGVNDPCNAPNQAANPVVAANCASEGVSPDFVQPAAQLKVTQGGNPELEPETSETFSVGVVFTPASINLRVAIDYYSVEVEDAIGTPIEGEVINTCYETPGLSAPECDRIGRGANGEVIRFELLNENLSTIETSGIDVNATSTWATNWGVVTADWLVNWLEDYTQITDTGTETDLTGVVSCDICSFAGYPEIKSTVNLSLSRNNWSTTLSWRYLDEMDVLDEAIGFEEFVDTADAVNYFDFLYTYNWESLGLSFAVENFTDEQPPYVPSVSTNTSPIYDPLGRFYSVRLKWSL